MYLAIHASLHHVGVSLWVVDELFLFITDVYLVICRDFWLSKEFGVVYAPGTGTQCTHTQV